MVDIAGYMCGLMGTSLPHPARILKRTSSSSVRDHGAFLFDLIKLEIQSKPLEETCQLSSLDVLSGYGIKDWLEVPDWLEGFLMEINETSQGHS